MEYLFQKITTDGWKFLNQLNLKNSNKRKHHFCTAGNSMEKGIRERVHECSSSDREERVA